ncbi:hypothetical protein [Aeoliella sp.]|uniref:hypothetical protein n=1 Tax=Aeoliella sp. TaxID=2795800 RepID=UPI003CCB9EB9
MNLQVVRLLPLLGCLLVCGSVSRHSWAAGPLFNPFDFDGTEVFFGGIEPSNFGSSADGLTPSAGSQLFGSGNGNSHTTFFNSGLMKTLGGTIQDSVYLVQLNIAWYNTGQNGGLILSDFDELYIGSEEGAMDWVSTPQPTVEDQWYTWSGVFTPTAADIGQPWTLKMVYDLPPKRDIAIDLPASGFARVIPEPSGGLIAMTGLCTLSLFATLRKRLRTGATLLSRVQEHCR